MTAPPVAGARTASPAVLPPPGNPRFALVDALRGIAVLCVMTFHVAGVTGENHRSVGDLVAVLNNEALVLFFALSGFLLYRPFVVAHAAGRPDPSVRRYARRRVLRILPAYWTALTVLAVWPGIDGPFTADWWRYYGFLQDYSARTLGGGIAPAWSLCVEVSFYLLLPVWALAIGRIARRRGAAATRWWRVELAALSLPALLGIATQLAASRLSVSSLLATTLLGESVWFAVGMALAVVSVAGERGEAFTGLRRRVTDRPGTVWVVALGCLAGAFAVLRPGGLFNIIVTLTTAQPYMRTLGGIALSAGLAVTVVLPAVFGEQEGGGPRRVLAWRPLALFGVISYGVYLYHLTVAELLGAEHDPHFSVTGLGLTGRVHTLTTAVVLAATLAVSGVIATVSYRVVELPFLRRKER